MFQITNILVPLILILLALLYFTYLEVQKGNQKRKLQQKITDLSQQKELRPTVIDQFQFQLIALDPLNKKLIHLNNKKETVIDLRNIKACNLIFKILSVQLELVYHEDHPKSAFTIVFYRKFIDKKNIRRALTRKAKRWEGRISENLAPAIETSPALTGFRQPIFDQLALK